MGAGEAAQASHRGAVPEPEAADSPLAFHILIDDQPVSEDRFTDALQLNLQSFRLAYPSHRHHLFGGDEIRALLSDHFDADVVAAYDALRPYAFKADLARYCLLYLHGGIYSDLSYLHVQPIRLAPTQTLALFRDVTTLHPVAAASNAVIRARPRHPVMEAAVCRIVAHHRAGFLGSDPLEPTGPHLLGSILNDRDADQTLVLGRSVLINRDHRQRNNIVKLLPNGELVALRNKGMNSSITELVRGARNNYDALWRAGAIWADRTPDPDAVARAIEARSRKRGIGTAIRAWLRAKAAR